MTPLTLGKRRGRVASCWKLGRCVTRESASFLARTASAAPDVSAQLAVSVSLK